MKNLIIIAVLAISMAGFAQKGKEQGRHEADFTPEQKAVLQTKKMALRLDLSQDQQNKLQQVNQKWASEREARHQAFKNEEGNKEDLTSDQKFEHLVQRLDARMAYQQEVKKILNKEQYESWKEMQGKFEMRGERNRRSRHRSRQG